MVDWGAKYNGYCSDNTRTIVYNEKEQEIFDIVRESHDKAIKAIKPGLKCCEIDKVSRDIIKEYGYGDKFIHSTGHSLGLDIHETPTFNARDDTIIEKVIFIHYFFLFKYNVMLNITCKIFNLCDVKLWFL